MRVTIDEPRANRDSIWMRASAQIRKRDAERRKRVKWEMATLFGLSARRRRRDDEMVDSEH